MMFFQEKIAYTADDLAIIQREIEEQSETAQVESRRVAAAASNRYGELLDKRTEIKEALAK